MDTGSREAAVEIRHNYAILASLDDRWRKTTLRECAVINDSTYSRSEDWPFINYLDTASLTENYIAGIQHLIRGVNEIPSRARRKVLQGDIVYSMVRPDQRHYGIIRQPPKNFLVSTGFAALRGREGVAETSFLYWLLTQTYVVDYLQGLAEQSVSAFPAIKVADLESLPLRLPSIPVQKRISNVLDAFDRKIEVNRSMDETLEEAISALFKSWFVDFDPVRLQASRISAELAPEIGRLFPSRLVKSDIGEIPDGWGVRSLGELVEFAYGKALRSNERRGGDIPVYGSNGQIGWHDRKIVDGPGIVVGRKGNPGVVTWSQSGFFPIDTTFYVVPKEPREVSLRFLFYALRNQNLPSIAADSAVPGLNRNIAYMSPQLVPSAHIMEAFDSRADSMLSRRDQLGVESRSLANLRDALLPKLLSGEIRIRDAEKIAETAT